MRGDASVLTAHWRGHLAADFAADYVAAGEDVRHVRGQEFIDANLTLVAKFDSGFFYGDPVGVRAAAVATKSFPARNSPVGLPVPTDDDFNSVWSHRARGGVGDYFARRAGQLSRCVKLVRGDAASTGGVRW